MLWTTRRFAMPSVPGVGARTRCTYLKRMRPATAEDRLAGSRLTPDAIEAAAHAANDGIAFTGDAFDTAAYLAEVIPDLCEQSLVADRDTANSD